MPSVADFYDTGPGPIICEPPIPANSTDGGMVSSVSDLDTFLRAIFTNQLVSPQSLDEMLDTNQFVRWRDGRSRDCCILWALIVLAQVLSSGSQGRGYGALRTHIFVSLAVLASTVFVAATPQSVAAAEAAIPSLWVVDDVARVTYNVGGWAQRVVWYAEHGNLIYRG